MVGADGATESVLFGLVHHQEWRGCRIVLPLLLLELLTKRRHRTARLIRLTVHGTRQEQADQRSAVEEDQAAATASRSAIPRRTQPVV